jgi:hypothetical protein
MVTDGERIGTIVSGPQAGYRVLWHPERERPTQCGHCDYEADNLMSRDIHAIMMHAESIDTATIRHHRIA